MDIEEPVSGWDCSTLHFHATLAGMLSATLIRNKVIQVGQPREKCLLAAAWMMKAFHGKQFPLDGIMRLIQEGAGYRHLGVGEDRIPAGFFVLKPAPDPRAIRYPSRGGHVVGKVP